MNKKILKLFMDWCISSEWGFKTWKLKEAKVGKGKWILRKLHRVNNKKSILMTITFEEYKND